jgi:hypothetical protein
MGTVSQSSSSTTMFRRKTRIPKRLPPSIIARRVSGTGRAVGTSVVSGFGVLLVRQNRVTSRRVRRPVSRS